MVVTGTVEKTIFKVRGITLKYNASKLVNFEVISAIIPATGTTNTVNVYTEKKNKRKRKGGGGHVSIVTEQEDKIYRISF